MASFTLWDDTSGWGLWGSNTMGNRWVGSYQFTTGYTPPPKPPTMAAWRRLRLAETRTRPRTTSDPLPPSETPRPRTVRRELQRAGPVGFTRLGGRRPL